MIEAAITRGCPTLLLNPHLLRSRQLLQRPHQTNQTASNLSRDPPGPDVGKASSTGFRTSHWDVRFIPAIMDINRLRPNVLEGLATGLLSLPELEKLM